MRPVILFLLIGLGACATDPAAYDAECMRLHVPANFKAVEPGQASANSALGGGTVPRSVATAEILEVNCQRDKLYEVEGEPGPTDGEPQPL